MKMKVFAAVLFVCSLFVNLSAGAELQLVVMRFEEGRTVKFEMVPTSRASQAQMKAQVKLEEGQQHIELEYKNLKRQSYLAEILPATCCGRLIVTAPLRI